MKNQGSRLGECAYALLRIASGAMFAFHGAQKVFGLLGADRPPVGSQLWIGGVIELVGGSLIALGLFASLAGFLCSGTMAVAYFQYHWKFRFDESFLPAVNQGELAALYCFVFLVVATKGNGAWSLGPDKK
jgi:putative oxidoreductase